MNFLISGNSRFRRLTVFLAAAVLALAWMRPAGALAPESKVVRVGWYESAFHRTDQFGRRSGYGYEYQQRISIYTGWKYEYVDGSWPELLEKLIAGEIDLLSDVSYTEDRAEKILYSAESMGSEGYYLFISPGNTAIRPDEYATLNGKRIAVNKNSIQERMLTDWAESHGVTPQIIETLEKTPVLLEKLTSGEYDALVTLDTYGNSADLVPVCKVGFAESFFGLNRNRPDLKQDLDVAMNRLLEENRDFNQQLAERFNPAATVNSFLSVGEKEWLSVHSPIRVGYRDNYLPYCGQDPQTGQLSGALLDFLSFAEGSQRNAQISFQAIPFPTPEDALRALVNHEIDCAFPLSLSTWDAEQYHVVCTDPLISTEMYATVRTSDPHGLQPDSDVRVALLAGNPNYETFVRDYFPNWRIAWYESREAAFQAVASGESDAFLISNFRLPRLHDLFQSYNLTALTTSRNADVSFAVNREDDCLFSILNKATRKMTTSSFSSALNQYSVPHRGPSLRDFLRKNWGYFAAAGAVIVIAILLLVMRTVKSRASARERQRIIAITERDALTGLYNWNYFLLYAQRMHQARPDRPMDAVVLNIDRFHSVNALLGREYGDQVLQALGKEIQTYVGDKGGIAGRAHADRFNLYCPSAKDWQPLLDQLQGVMERQFEKAGIHLRMGVKPWQEGMEPVLQFDKARIACGRLRGGFTSRVMVFDADMERQEERDQLLLNGLERALKERELVVYYQPKYLIRSDPPTLSSAEALVRWNHPELGMIPPDEFIGLFERSGQISLLDQYVWREAARQIAAWREEYQFTLPVSVNLSRVDVFDPTLMVTLDGIVRQYGLKNSDLKLEVTESAYTENADQLIRVIGELRRKGYEIEMDDFGSGYSSLNMLSSLPVDVLKMDIAFIRNIERNEKDFRLVKLILDIAGYLKVPVIAEGVETESQLELLRNAGCDLVQGYLFSCPLPPDEFARKILLRR